MSVSAGARIGEDHDLDEPTRVAAWQDLVDWVIWLHDRYELSAENRLPGCWPEHPGLVEELAALKAWRTEIYTPAWGRRGRTQGTASGNGGPARAWHGELRNVLHAAATVYAPGCRAGHRSAPRLLTGDDRTRAQWLDAIPARVLRRAAPADPPATQAGRVLTASAMRTASVRGLAVALPAVPGYSRHHGVWWAQAEHGDWAEVTDPDMAERLEVAARALHTADAAVTRGLRARSADSSNTADGGGPRHDHRQGIEDELGPNAADDDAKSCTGKEEPPCRT